MKPFIFQFTELPDTEAPDYSQVRYSPELRLQVDQFNQPAIEITATETTTFTKTTGEGPDSDASGLLAMLDTETRTFTTAEQSDSDRDRLAMERLLDTSTTTHTTEPTDEDKP